MDPIPTTYSGAQLLMSIASLREKSRPIFPFSSRRSSNGHQSQDRQGAWPRNPGHVARPRRRGDRVRRRDFITLLGGAAIVWPLTARAQQGERMRRVGVLVGTYGQTDREGQDRIAVFLDTFRKLGWSDGRNVRIDYRWGGGDANRSKTFAEELVRSAPDVIVAVNNSTLAELQRLTRTIPIVFAQVSDPVGSGFVAGIA